MIAYLILAHAHPLQVKRLVEGVSGPHSRCYVHIDAKARLEDFISVLPETTQVIYVRDRLKVTWGGFNMTLATLKLMEAAAKDCSTHYVFLSGSDYPIRSQQDLCDLLACGNSEFIGMTRMPNTGVPMSRLEYFHIASRHYASLSLRLLNRALQLLPKRNVNRGLMGLKPYCGLSWWCLTDECVRYILNFVKQHPTFVEFFGWSKSGDNPRHH